MKKIVALPFLTAWFNVQAQSNNSLQIDRELTFDILHMSGALIGIYLISTFVLLLIKLFLDNRLKKAILERKSDDDIVRTILNLNKTDLLNSTVKWFIILIAIGMGLLITAMSGNWNIYGAIIIIFFLSIGYLVYFFYLKKRN